MLSTVRTQALSLLYGGAVAHNADSRGQAFVANVYSLLAFLSLTIFGLQHILYGNNLLLGELEIIGGLTIAGNAIAMRLTANIPLARNNLLLIMLGLLVVMLVTGGLGGTGIFWFFVFPASAFFLTGKRGGTIWTIALLLTILAVLALDRTGLLVIQYPPIVIRQLLVTLLVVSVGIYAYQQSRETLTLESKQNQETSKEEKIKSETIIENVAEGIVAIDQSGRVMALNKPGETMLGWRRQQLLGKQFVKAVPMLNRNNRPVSVEDRPLQIALRTPGTFSANAAYVRKDGGLFPAVITSRSLVVNGKIRGAIGTFRDVTQEQAIEHAKSEFVTLASHQLRTPVSAIKWYSELLLSGDAGALDLQQHEYIQQIYTSNIRLSAIIDAMLLASNLELDNLTVRTEPTNLAKMTKLLLVDLLHIQPINKKLVISETYDPDLPDIPLDPTLTKTILRNVLSNAIKYTPTGGKVSVTILLDDAKLSPLSKGSVRITVTDTGYGIPKSQQKNIFVKLFRAANIKEKDTDGTGLGLYVTKALLEQVGGKISFTSKENKGSTFVIMLPLEGMRPHKGSTIEDRPQQHERSRHA